jgi:dienelactone hydrolase
MCQFKNIAGIPIAIGTVRRKVNLLICCCLYAVCIFSQKPPLDFDAIKQWPQIFGEKVSNDGSWAIYSIGRGYRADSLVLWRTDRKIQLGLGPADNFFFTENSRYLIIHHKEKRLSIYDLQGLKWIFQADSVVSVKTPAAGEGKWLAYQKTNGQLLLRNLYDESEQVIDQAGNYQFSDNGNILLMQQSYQVKWMDLVNNKTVTLVARCKTINSIVFDETATQLAFLADTMLLYYKKGMDSAIVMAKAHGRYNPAPGIIKFSSNGQRIFFPVKAVAEQTLKPATSADVNIWHYDDDYLPTEQQARSGYLRSRTYTVAINIADKRITMLDEEGDDPLVDLASTVAGEFALIKRDNFFAGRWKASTVPQYCLKNLQTGEKKLLLSQRDIFVIGLSPGCKYVTWYDNLKESYFSYETATGVTRNITHAFPVALRSISASVSLYVYQPYGVAGWTDNEASVLIYDEFDIWKVDVSGNKAPVNITNGYGKKHHLVLRVWNEKSSDYDDPAIESDELLLVAFDKENKDNGFFKKNLRKNGDPEKLSLGPNLYYAHNRFNTQFLYSRKILKAKSAGMYLLGCMSSHEFPNLCVTKDFKSFTVLSDLHPEKKYNWLTTELHSWRKDDGAVLQGVLYKPENFDPNKRYPIIFYFYEKLSHRLNQYFNPELSEGSINIPIYVSNGYLVFTPDIIYGTGTPGEDVCSAVLSVARYLSALPYVDSTKMGLQGHSFGGYQVNYLISHSNLFAAAQESSGASDFISYYNGFYREHSAQFYFETGQGRIGATLWEKPDLFIKNSPIFLADKVQTPLLIMHNKDDGEVPFQQGLEWFTALRRLGKKVWMLQYDKEYHAINQQKNKLDFSIRTKQFFDHYLKGIPAPGWMTNKENKLIN